MNWTLPFHIHTDASYKFVGVVLGKNKDKSPYASHFIRKNLAGAELNYIVTKKNFLIVIHALKNFIHYVTGYQFFVHIDHATILYLMNKHDINGRIIR